MQQRGEARPWRGREGKIQYPRRGGKEGSGSRRRCERICERQRAERGTRRSNGRRELRRFKKQLNLTFLVDNLSHQINIQFKKQQYKLFKNNHIVISN